MRRYKNVKYRLTQKVSIHGCSCKLPKYDLEELLKHFSISYPYPENVIAGIGDDSGITLVEDVAILHTVDFFTPIIDDPYIQGQIAACNSTNDIYAKGILDISGVLLMLGFPTDMPDIVKKKLIEGFFDFCRSIEAPVVGGHTIFNPWPIIGGAVTGFGKKDRIILNSTARAGDVLILTKPLGIQPAMALLRLDDEMQDYLTEIVSEKILERAIDKAIEILTTTNKFAATILNDYSVHASTDVTGFGLLGHASEMAKRSGVNIIIDALPVIRGTLEVSKELGYGLEIGKAAETAGGLLLSVGKDTKDDLLMALGERGYDSFEIGWVEKGTGTSRIVDDPEIIEI